ncbi:methylmalonyl Co-A mutase-associated GTPase MeaB [Echinicola marina]|uniref:methylmalonyl Co-A mutase-associated GTPase MeaB n=1 Tax=Echinicola marina TaxID=2859768 RepID=UPI001CF65509|nr:methylmalonyl Co-A mutase-associated GTPase MeaB [Echinicola marina]UCS93468.1 methylmalonyl Co-A mutase-associated GTPase MeaB [Echinicola marina]
MSMTNRKRLKLSEYEQGLLAKDTIILSRAITLLESKLEVDQSLGQDLIDRIMKYTGNSIRIGVTGAGGVGKSTFIEHFGQLLVERGKRLAVLTIDPSSQKSKGSILGDKTRMELLSKASNVFIRPSPNAQSLGGVGARTRESILLCEAAGFDVILVETVGAGQSEFIVNEMVDFLLLLVQPDAGDELQGIKRGIMEMADAIVLTKVDGDLVGKAEEARAALQSACQFFGAREDGWLPKVMECSSINQVGLDEVWQVVQEFEKKMNDSGHFNENRFHQREYWFYAYVQQILEARFYQNKDVQAKIKSILPSLKEGGFSPQSMARNLVNDFFKRNK